MGIELYVLKETDMVNATLKAIGLAEFLYQIAPNDIEPNVLIEDMGAYYVVSTPMEREMLVDAVQNMGRLPNLIQHIVNTVREKEAKDDLSDDEKEEVHKKQEKRMEQEVINHYLGQPINYLQEEAKPQSIKFLSSEKRSETDIQFRDRAFGAWQFVAKFNSGKVLSSYRNLIRYWVSHQQEYATKLVHFVLDYYSALDLIGTSEYTETALKEWQTQVKPPHETLDGNGKQSATVGVFPSWGKGVNQKSANKYTGNKNEGIFWLDLYFAFAGLMVAGMPYSVDGSDTVLYYPLPLTITIVDLKHMVAEYRDDKQVRVLADITSYPRYKMDVMQTLQYYLTMLRFYRRSIPEGYRRVPAYLKALSGVGSYYYKNLKGFIPFSESFFNLPRWFPVDEKVTLDAIDSAIELLKKHFELIKALEKEKEKDRKVVVTPEQFDVIRAYRAFITLGGCDEWVEFAIEHQFYYVRTLGGLRESDRGRGNLPTTLSIKLFNDTLELLLNNYQKERMMSGFNSQMYNDIFNNEGFINISDAIRASTVRLIYRTKKQGLKSPFKERYGLGEDLRRSAHDATLFLEKLSDFIMEYQEESHNVLSRDPNAKRTDIKEGSLMQIAELVARYSASLVARLLIAQGYSSYLGDGTPKSNS